MNVRIFFDPVSTELTASELLDPFLFFHSISTYTQTFPEIHDIDIAIIGISESGGTLTNKGVEKAADAVRKKLYRLKKGTGSYRIADLGNIRQGVTTEESYLRIKEVVEYLLQINVVPVLLGGSHDIDLAQFWAYQGSEQFISVLTVDSFMDMQAATDDMSKHHTHRMLVHEPNYLFNYSHLAYQSFLTDSETINVLEKLYFESYRIGQLKENISEMEPVIRSADMMSFDITAIRASDAPGNAAAQPFGLSGEEACQLCWYAGINTKLTSLGIYEYNPEYDERGITASVVATMIWYFIEGYYHRKPEESFDSKHFMRYIVPLPGEPHQLTFYKHLSTEKWWMEVPYPSYKKQLARNSIVPCAYTDYVTANKGELPYRWINTHAKLI
ncbi:MAG: formimidoylglutamase [Cytophagaceae bacterium]|jgi:formiminoglutamase|nr:formimidoylglutamase [Cytophagaceae bacterium]